MGLRLIFFLSVLIAFSVLEHFITRREDLNGLGRKVSNFFLLFIGSLASQLLYKVSPVVISSFSSLKGIGLFNLLDLPHWGEIFCGIVLLDLLIYSQHRYFHYSNFFWKFHRVHHLDNLLDVTTALRFHPIEILFSLIIKSVAVLVLGLSVETVVIFEIILSSMAIFNHSNINLPKGVEKVLSLIVVTPNFHVIHHHPLSHNHNSNYGFNLSIWDYMFNTFSKADTDDFSTYDCGLDGEKENTLKGMLLIPFKK